MKIKEILIIVAGVSVIIIAGYFSYTSLNPKAGGSQEEVSEFEPKKEDNFQFVKENFDEQTLEEIKKLSDYGEPNLEGVGKEDPFSR